MAIKKYNLDSSPAPLTLLTLATVIGALHFGKEILLPLFLAALLSFVLAPIVVALERHPVDAAVLAALPPLGSRKSRYLCKRLRRHDPDLRIIVALLGGQRLRKTRQRLLDSGANLVTTTLPETIKAIRLSHATTVSTQPHWQASMAASASVDLVSERQ